MTTSISRLLRRRALLDRGTPALVTPSERLTFGDLDRRSDSLATALATHGLGPGDRVATLLRNGAEIVELYYAAAKLGAVLCNLNFRLTPPELASILRDCEPRLLVVGDEFQGLAYRAGKEAQLPTLWSVGGAERQGVPRLEAMREGTALKASLPDPAPDSPLLLVYTSGTTGKPKGAIFTQAGMYWTSATMAYSLDYRYRDVNLIPVPMFHVGGMSFATFFVHMGATAVVPPAWEPGAILELVERERVNHFFAVAAMLQGLLDHPRFPAADLGSVRWILAGGAPVPATLIRRFEARGVAVQQTYGSTETGGPATVVDLPHAATKAASIGLPFFHTEVRIVDASGGAAATGTIGEIEVRAPHLFAGYWRDEAATQEAFVDGWLRTGDLGYRDEDGYLFIIERKKDVIISGGENIYPAEIEALFEDHPDIAEIAIVAAPDERWGEIPCAIVVGRPGRPVPTLDGLIAFCADRLARYKQPKMLVVSKQPLPRNATGKLLKHVLRDKVAQRS